MVLEGHVLWIVIAVAVVFILQFGIFISTLSKLGVFRDIFAKKNSAYSVITKEDTNVIIGIASKHHNKLLSSIIDSINNYLSSNSQSTADFHLIKDMVERGCESSEEEINSQVPMPLYCGLMGTMFGILVGVGYLVLTDGLTQLIDAGAHGASGIEGIEALLEGVALAMITSIVGIIFTTIGSYVAKDAKKKVETDKNTFLSWMQAKLLPELSSDTVGALSKLTINLKDFNDTFSKNTKELKDILGTVKDTTDGQAKLLKQIENLNINRIAAINADAYEKLKSATGDVEKFGEYVSKLNGFIENVQTMSSRLGETNERTRMIEEMAAFFKQERANLDTMKGLIAKTIGEADEKLHEVAANFKTSSADQFKELTNHTAKQQENFKAAADEQLETMKTAISGQKSYVEKALQERIDTLNKLSTELEQIKPVKESLGKLEAATQEQNKKLDSLTHAIMRLAEVKSVPTGASTPVLLQDNKPKWPAIVGCSAVIICCLVVIISVLV